MPDLGSTAKSAKTSRLQIFISLDDLAQPIFGRAIAAIGVRVMALHQHLEAQLDLGGGCSRVEPKRVERPALGVADDTALTPAQALVFGTGTVRAKMAKQVEWIVDIIEMRLEPRRIGSRRRATPVHAHFPGRPVADDRLLLVAGDVVLAHASEEIVGVVVLTHMAKAEAPVFVLAGAALGGAMGRGTVAARPFTARV